jgi:putative ATP-binding cassette transporter
MKNALKAVPWKRLYRIGKPFWVSEKRIAAILHLVAVLGLLSANAWVMVYMNSTAGHFMTAIEQRNDADFRHYLMMSALLILAVTPLQVFYGYLRTRLALMWRNWLTSSLFNGYFANNAYYKLLRNKDVDNPDQRMTQDVDSFCNSSVGLFISILDAFVNVCMMFGVLWAISPLLTGGVIAYSIVGSLIVVWIGSRLVNLQFQQSKTEADLRFGLAEVRREAEAISFYRGEEISKRQSNGRLGKVIETLLTVAGVYRNIQLFTTPFNMLVGLIPAAIMAPIYFQGEIAFGTITMATMAFAAIFNGATLLIGQFGGITNYAAVINRLGSFIESLDAAGIEQLPPGKYIEVHDGDTITFDKATVMTPDLAKVLVKDLDISVPPGHSLLITGPDGAGKTALLRVVAGMWNAGFGRLIRPPSAQLMFLTQNPYLPPTTLREAICYPGIDVCPDDERILQVLRMVNLSDVVERAEGLDTVQNWRDTLSLSQQQRLSIARIIQHNPRYVAIDEATSALEPEAEHLFYSLLRTLGTTIVSVGNGMTLAKYHTQVLELNGDGTWKSYPASNYKPREFK